jgi:hypothetical protein
MSKIGGVVVAGVLAVGGIGAYEKWGKGGEDNTVRDQTGEIVEQGELGVFVIQAGDCFDMPIAADDGASWSGVQSIQGKPCTSPHDAEAVGEYKVVDEVFRSTDEYIDESFSKCVPFIESYTGKSGDELLAIWPEIAVAGLAPTSESFAEGDRIVTCYAILADGVQFEMSVKG